MNENFRMLLAGVFIVSTIVALITLVWTRNTLMDMTLSKEERIKSARFYAMIFASAMIIVWTVMFFFLDIWLEPMRPISAFIVRIGIFFLGAATLFALYGAGMRARYKYDYSVPEKERMVLLGEGLTALWRGLVCGLFGLSLILYAVLC